MGSVKLSTEDGGFVTSSFQDNGEVKEQKVSVMRTESFDSNSPTNEYVLNVAWVSFLLFAVVQFFFSILAKSESMMTDCASMMVDTVTYLLNYCAERMKHGTPGMSPSAVRLRRLYLELLPPLISVTTLIVVTGTAMRQAFHTLTRSDEAFNGQPHLGVMLLFSSLNLLLDALNVHCFARAHQAVGLVALMGRGNSNISDEESRDETDNNVQPVLTEATSLLAQKYHDESSKNGQMADGSTHGSGNLNMCSAWTHVCADTLRSASVLVASLLASIFPAKLSAPQADSGAAIVVSIIILVSLVPLIQGLFLTAVKIRKMWNDNT